MPSRFMSSLSCWKSQLRRAFCHERADRHARRRDDDAAANLLENAPALEHLLEIDAARARGITQRLRGEHRALHGFFCRNVQLRGPRAHGNGHAGLHEIHAASGPHLAIRDQLVDRIARQHHHIDRFAGLHALGHIHPARGFGGHGLSGGLAKSGRERVQHFTSGHRRNELE